MFRAAYAFYLNICMCTHFEVAKDHFLVLIQATVGFILACDEEGNDYLILTFKCVIHTSDVRTTSLTQLQNSRNYPKSD